MIQQPVAQSIGKTTKHVSGKYKRQMRLNWNHSSEGIIYQSASMDVDEPSTERVCDQEAK